MATISEEVSVQVRYRVTDEAKPDFSDALYYPINEYAAVKQADIIAEQWVRSAAWREFIARPPVLVLPEDEIVDIDREVVRLGVRKIELLGVIRDRPVRLGH